MTETIHSIDHYIILGWREWVDLPELGLRHIKAKVDTGARTSSLHAFQVVPFVENGQKKVRFKFHPIQNNIEVEVECIADVIDERIVSDSGGHREKRFVIKTPIRIGSQEWPIEITLTDRDTMRFRMLLGRTAMINRIIVNPNSSYNTGNR